MKTLNPLAPALEGSERRLLTTGVAVLFPISNTADYLCDNVLKTYS